MDIKNVGFAQPIVRINIARNAIQHLQHVKISTVYLNVKVNSVLKNAIIHQTKGTKTHMQCIGQGYSCCDKQFNNFKLSEKRGSLPFRKEQRW